eukprot:TRINITY_DN14847_c0_g1_i1.p1 TRINITY_DN14847_c0_g1~~TRINITY_DN14847_c0_g1_i1.p1  ORF type:complete len:196 (-),score=9.22 TRINITY_DN14847_c0_g1_i1:85-672(-)
MASRTLFGASARMLHLFRLTTRPVPLNIPASMSSSNTVPVVSSHDVCVATTGGSRIAVGCLLRASPVALGGFCVRGVGTYRPITHRQHYTPQRQLKMKKYRSAIKHSPIFCRQWAVHNGMISAMVGRKGTNMPRPEAHGFSSPGKTSSRGALGVSPQKCSTNRHLLANRAVSMMLRHNLGGFHQHPETLWRSGTY